MRKMHKYLNTTLALLIMLGAGNTVLANNNSANNQSGAAFALTLAAFDYVPVNAHTACFTWTTSWEANVQEIDLQASTDSIHFITVYAQRAFNNKFGHTYYSPVFNVDQYKYYRLVVVNETGVEDFSKTLHLVNTSLTKQDVTLFPNPVTGLSFNVKVPTLNQIAVNIFTKEGVLLFATKLQGQFQYRIQLPASASSNMNLVVQVTDNNKTQSFNVLNK
jgi:hypothetical protein